MTCRILLTCLLLCAPLRAALSLAQIPATPTIAPALATYPNTSEGLQRLIGDILQSAKEKDTAKETQLIHTLIFSEDSTWFTEEYGPGFGASLAAAYQRLKPGLEEEIKTIYEGDVNRGWTNPRIVQYTDPESVNAPLDHFLNCMNQIVPLYATAFQGTPLTVVMSLRSGDQPKQGAGDLDGYFVYDRGAFRFIPMQILLKLPTERPVRLQLDMNVMQSKLINQTRVRLPDEAIRKRISGRVIAELTLDVHGNLEETKVLEGDPILAAAVIDAVKQWRFAPTTLDGDPVEVVVKAQFEFEMH